MGVTGHPSDGEGSACGLCCLLCQTLPGLSHMCHTVLQVPAFTSRPSITLPTLFSHPGCITLFHTLCWPLCQPWQRLGCVTSSPTPSPRLTLVSTAYTPGKPPPPPVFPDDPLLIFQSNISKWRLHILTLSIYLRRHKIDKNTFFFFFDVVYLFPQTDAVISVTLPLSIIFCQFPLALYYG